MFPAPFGGYLVMGSGSLSFLAFFVASTIVLWHGGPSIEDAVEMIVVGISACRPRAATARGRVHRVSFPKRFRLVAAARLVHCFLTRTATRGESRTYCQPSIGSGHRGKMRRLIPDPYSDRSDRACRSLASQSRAVLSSAPVSISFPSGE